MFHQWGGFGFTDRAFLINLVDTTEVQCLVQGEGGDERIYCGDTTTDSPVTTNRLLRSVCRMGVSPKTRTSS
jgi:hypothetical protein